MLKELFVNACILITIIFIGSQIFKSNTIDVTSSLQTKILIGLFGGLTACILMTYSIELTPQVMLDFRDICIVLTAMFGGFLPVMITGIITMVFRLLYHGLSEAALIFSIGILLASLGCGALSKSRLNQFLQYFVMLTYCLMIRSIIYIVEIRDKVGIRAALLGYWISSFVVGIGVYYLVLYLISARNLLISLKKESSHDYLTGLRNTRQFDTKYNVLLKETMENNGRIALLIIDIDHFKHVNDNYGHAAGDVVLKEIGILLKRLCREQAYAFRIGGEEFAVMVRNMDVKNTKDMAESIRRTVEASPFTITGGKKIKITVSIGAAIYPDTLNEIEKLKEAADMKLYTAKRTGRNKVCI